MRGLPVLVLLVIILPICQPGPSSPLGVATGTDAPDVNMPRQLSLVEVCPGKPVEYLVVQNQGDAVEMRGTVFSDGEGNITFVGNMTVPHGERLAVASDPDAFRLVHPDIVCIGKQGGNIEWSGRFTLADAGDEVLFMNPDGSLLDVVAYGSSRYVGSGWDGPPAPKPPLSHSLVRRGPDTDTGADWTAEPPGRSRLSPITSSAVVEPFTIPEQGVQRIAREIALASQTVNCSVYEVYDPSVVGLLVQGARRGLDVHVLVEGQPVGGMDDRSARAAATMRSEGIEVRELHTTDSYRRYDYLHCKYVVTDGRRVLLSSENWGVGMIENRGWGVTIDSPELGRYFDGLFDADFNGPLDVTLTTGSADKLELLDIVSDPVADVMRYRCAVSPLVSPDFSYSEMSRLIQGATTTILVQQLSVDEGWLDRSSLVGDLLAAAQRGVRTRVLLDSSWGGEENAKVVERLNALATEGCFDLEARMVSPYHSFSVMHNKGVIVDDAVVISSINWGDGPLFQNREVGVVVCSQPVSELFSALFWQDWSVDPVPPKVQLPWLQIRVAEGEPVLLDASKCTDNGPSLSVSWDIDQDGVADNTSGRWTVRLPPGDHMVTLTLVDQGGNRVNATCQVIVVPRTRAASDLPPYLIAVPLAIAAAATLVKRIIHRKHN